MASREIFYTEMAPEPKGPYSQAIVHKGVLYLSGQVPADSATGALVRGTIEDETEAVLKNMKIIIEEAGASLEDAIRVTCYLADLTDFDRFNSVYERYFSKSPPARTTFQAGRLPFDVQVEIDAIVALPEEKDRHQ